MRNRISIGPRSFLSSRRALLGLAAAGALLAACSGGPSAEETSGAGGAPRPGSTTGETTGGGHGGSGGSAPSLGCSVQDRGIQVSEGKATNPAIARGKDHFAVAFTSLGRDGGDIVFALLDDKGKKVKQTPIDVGPGVADHASVVELDGGYLVLWQVSTAATSIVRGRYLGDDGSPRGTTFTVGNSHSKDARPAGVGHGKDAVVAYQDGAAITLGLLHEQSLAQRQSIAKGTDPALGAADGHIGATWLADSHIGFSKIEVPVGPLDPMFSRDANGKANLPRIAAHPDGTFDLVWEDGRGGADAETVYFTRIGLDSKTRGEILVPGSDGSANTPDVATLGDRSAVVYYQFRDGPPAIYLSLISADFLRADDDLQISGKGARFPRVAVSGDALAVVYAEISGPVRVSLVSCR